MIEGDPADGAGTDRVPAVLRGYRYKPRLIAFQGHRAVGRWRVKATIITLRGTAAHFVDEIDAAWDQAAPVLNAIAADGTDAGVASLIVHIGRAGVWLLLDWWSQGDLMRHRHFFASLDDPARFTDVGPRHIGPCVWELAVQAHERQAWLVHVLANPAGPDLDAYLADGLTALT